MPPPYLVNTPLTCAQVRELDRRAIEDFGVPGVVLMENAGRAIAEAIYERLSAPTTARALILCGPGNNGGDGFVIARHLYNANVNVTVVCAAPRDKAKGDAATNLRIVEKMSIPLIDVADDADLAATRGASASATVIVDALLGTGSGGDPRGAMAALIEMANAREGVLRVAVDLPTGLDADAGTTGTPCFQADLTVTLLAPKVGFASAAARAAIGELRVAGIGVPREILPKSENPPNCA